MKHCLYCAQHNTRLDIFGYCKKYNCFDKSGLKKKYDEFIKQASNFYTRPKEYRQIAGPVTNSYNVVTREANNLMQKVIDTFGFLPMEIYESIPMEHRKKWDKNIRW